MVPLFMPFGTRVGKGVANHFDVAAFVDANLFAAKTNDFVTLLV